MRIFWFYISIFFFSFFQTVFTVLDQNVKSSTKPPLKLEKLPWHSHFELQSPTEYYEEDEIEIDKAEYLEKKNPGFHSFNSLCPPGETGQFHYPSDCKRFVNCWRGRSSIQVCAPGTLFNPETRECDYPAKVKCRNGNYIGSISQPKERYVRFPQHRPPIGHNPRIARNQNENPTSETIPAKPYPGRPPYFGPSHLKPPTRPTNTRYLCPVGATGIFPHPTDCSKFVECFSGGTFIKNCGPGTLFNTMTSSCDHPHNVACSHEGQLLDLQEILSPDVEIPEESILHKQYQKSENIKPSFKKGRKNNELQNSNQQEISENLIISSTPKIEKKEMLETSFVSQTEILSAREPKVINIKSTRPNQFSKSEEKELVPYLMPPQYNDYEKFISNNGNQDIQSFRPNEEKDSPIPFEENLGKKYPSQGLFSQNQFLSSHIKNSEKDQNNTYLGYILSKKHSSNSDPDQTLTSQNLYHSSSDHLRPPFSNNFYHPSHSNHPHRLPSFWLQPPPFQHQHFTHYAPNHPFFFNHQPPILYNYPLSQQPNFMTALNRCPVAQTIQKNHLYPSVIKCVDSTNTNSLQPPFQTNYNNEKQISPSLYYTQSVPDSIQQSSFNSDKVNIQSQTLPYNFHSSSLPLNSETAHNFFSKEISQHKLNYSPLPSEATKISQKTETNFQPHSYNQENVNTNKSETNNSNGNEYNANSYIPNSYLNPTFWPTLSYIPQQNVNYPPIYHSQNSNNKITEQTSQEVPLNPSQSLNNPNNQQLHNFYIPSPEMQIPYYPNYSSFSKQETNYSVQGQLSIPIYNNLNNRSDNTKNILPFPNTNSSNSGSYDPNFYSENHKYDINSNKTESSLTATLSPFLEYTVQTTKKEIYPPIQTLYSNRENNEHPKKYMLDKIDVRTKSGTDGTNISLTIFPKIKSEENSEKIYKAVKTKIIPTNHLTLPSTFNKKDGNENLNDSEENESPQKTFQIKTDVENFNYQEPEKLKPTKIKRKPYVKVMQTPPNGQTIRLRNGATQLDGYLEMKDANSKWGLVCDEISDWTIEEATIACRELGFIRGAELSWQGYPIKSESENIQVAVFSLNCTGSEESISECQIKYKDNSQCNVGKQAVGLRCYGNLASHCQPEEILYNHNCYKLFGKENPDDPSIKTEDASNQCKKFGGKLVDITTQYENDFISEWLIKKYPEVTSVATGGIGISVLGRPMWIWEGTNDPMVFERWWSGWSGDRKIPKGSINGPLCIVLKKTFACDELDGEKLKNTEEACSADYFFWDVENCNELQTSVFICERPMDDIGCVIGTGEGYVGTANTTASGQPCLPWDHPKVVEGLSRRVSVQERSSRLIGHNYCRNLGNPDRHPWCFIEGKGNSEYCAIPQCWNSGYHRSSDGVYSSCDENHFECKPGECIKKKWICDGQRDCSNNKDEELCTFFLQEFKTSQNKRMKGNGREKWNNMNENMCAKQCLEHKNFKCKSFSYSKKNQFCHLSDTNTLLSGQLINASNWTYYELIVESFQCTIENGFFGCQDGKCINISNVCDGKKNCEDGSDEKDCKKLGYRIRLAGSKDGHKGRIEIGILGKWGVICDDKFDLRDANVVCRELGFKFGAAEILQHSQFPVENPLFLIDDLECLGNETSVRECSFPGWGKHDCGAEEIVGVICKVSGVECPSDEWQCRRSKECISISYLCDEITDCNDKSDEDKELCNAPTQIRLSDGPNVTSGRLEISHLGIWGTVCDDDFNVEAANVVCRLLGYFGLSTVKKNAFFGPGKGPIWLDEVHCIGNETSIEECAYPHWGKNNCKHDEDVGIICSRETHQKSSKIKPIASSSGDDSVEKEEKLRQILISECNGISKPKTVFTHYKYERVVGGTDTAREAVPWQASIRVKSGAGKSVHWCGAIILSPYHILTAGHCLRDYNKAAYFVRVGDYDTEVMDTYEEEYGIDHLYIHPNFSKQINLNNDIGLIKIKGEIQLNDQVRPACLAPSTELYHSGTNCTVSGWGSVSAQSAGFARTLRRAFIPILENTTCRAPFVYGNSLSEGMFCAGKLDGKVDSCQGDSGGPLVCQYQDREYLFGITSWGHGCGRPNKPGVYTNVAFYTDWIQEKIRLSIS